ncbi:MAG: lipoyl synthase [Candidatus Omnitrophica bacterium]|nr:lipoyl synthase [Candidatus Omnitrophota bacterium]
MSTGQFPLWLKKKIPSTTTCSVENVLKSNRLHTVCQSARCPNKSECFSKQRATFLILGNICTRHCSFCSVKQGTPREVDTLEPERIVLAIEKLKLKYVVITSVSRDDLYDGGAAHFAHTVNVVKRRLPNVSVEVLTPDFQGDLGALKTVCDSNITIFNHNVETIKRLYPIIRPNAQYERSLTVLQKAKEMLQNICTKSGLMVGLGENDNDVFEALDDLRSVQCDIVTIGQYLKPCEGKHEVARFVKPEVFEKYEQYAKKIGFTFVSAGPFVRSSYKADEAYASVRSECFA